MAGPVTEIAEAPELGIGPQIPDPTHKPEPPPPLFGTEVKAVVPPESDKDKPEVGPAETPAWDWSKADPRRGKPEDVPEEHRKEFSRLQRLFKEVQGERDRQGADLRRREQAASERERRVEALERRLTTLAEQPAQTPATKAKADVTTKKISEILEEAKAAEDDDTENAISIMRQVVDEAFEEKLGDRITKIDQALPVIESLNTTKEQERVGAISTQLTEAQEKHGKEEVDAYSNEILDALGLDARWNRVREPWTNRATGQPHTIMSLYEWFSGKTAAEAEAARDEDGQLREGKKKQVPPGSPKPTPPASAQLSEAEALKQIKALQL